MRFLIPFGMSRIFSVLLFLSLTDCETSRIDICSTQRLKTVFLGLGEAGVLTASNVSHRDSVNANLHKMCRADIVTCPSCIVLLNFRLLNLSCFCGVVSNLFLHNPCRCDYVWVSEPPYNEASGVSFCKVFPLSGSHDGVSTYKSKTRTVRIWFFYRKSHAHAFTVDYKSEKNRQVFFGTCQYPQLNFSLGSISSPFFPEVYPRDLVAEYVLNCIKHSNLSSQEAEALLDGDRTCRVRLRFTDFHLASASVVEFYDGNRRVGVVSGTSFRPPVIVSKTNSLTVRFMSFGYNDMGFKAVFSFVSEERIKKPNTDCGGYVDNFGGTIAMAKMTKSHLQLFDCVWLIKPLKSFSNVEGYLYLKLTTYLGFAGDGEFQIRQGLTSESPILETLRYPVVQNFKEHVVSLQSGFYVSLRALFGPATKFALTYSLFSRKCTFFSGFLCKNFRCIEKKLFCDGSNHCGDNSDEPSACNQKWESELTAVGDRGEEFYTPNYYFPKMKDYSDPKMASVVFFVILVVLILLTSSVTVTLCRMVSKARRQRNQQDQLQAVSNFRDCLSDEVSMEDVVIDDPPSYEPPPNYEEVVKATKENCDSSATECRKIGLVSPNLKVKIFL